MSTARTSSRPVGIPHLREIVAPRVIRQGFPFEIRVTLDTTDFHACCDAPVRLSLFAYVNRVGDGFRHRVALFQREILAPLIAVALGVEPVGLPEGVYRLEAAATLECSATSAVLGCAFKEVGRVRVIA